jgi:hypothetical protein
MADDPVERDPVTPSEKDAVQEVGGRQPQRPGQHGRYQPRPGERDPDTLASTEPEGQSGPDRPRGVLPTAQNPRLGPAPEED